MLAVGNTIICLKHGESLEMTHGIWGPKSFILYMILCCSLMKVMKNQAGQCGYNEDILSLSKESSKKTGFHKL